MARYFKGAALGSHWHLNDARLSGFTAINVANSHSGAAIINHIVHGTSNSPYVSITKSWMMALQYARQSRLPDVAATANLPAYIYEIDFTDTTVSLYDAIVEIGKTLPTPHLQIGYAHNGDSRLIAAILNGKLANYLKRAKLTGPPNNNNAAVAPVVSDELRALLLTLRDAEVLVLHAIPRNYITIRHNVW
jgi:hypothetical protein